MHPLDFLRKNKKTLAVVVILILVGVSIALLAERGGKNRGEPQIPATEQGTEPVWSPATEPPVEATEKPSHTEEVEPVLTEDYELVFEGMNVFDFASHYTYFKYQDVYADLYRRKLQDDTGEYVELSLWSDQKEIWHTTKSDEVEACQPFWRDSSGHLTLEQGQCYYVVELDGTVYLMRYCVEKKANMVTMSYKVFGISPMVLTGYNGSEGAYDAGSISVYLEADSAISLDISFPIEQMAAFADTVRGYMENGHMVASTLHGAFELEPSTDKDNPISPYLYDIFPWLPQLVAQHGIDMAGIDSTQKLLVAVQNVLPTSASVIMPGVSVDGSHFITGDYYSESDESYLTVRMKEDGSYEGKILIDNALVADFVGAYDNAVLAATEITDYPEELPCEMEISFENGKATVTIIAASYPLEVGDTFTLDRNEKPEEFDYLRNAEKLHKLS